MSLHLPTEMLSDLMSGQIIIVMCFDNELFFHRANKTYPGLYLLSDAARTKQPLENILRVGSQGIASDVDGNTSFLMVLNPVSFSISNDQTTLLSGAMLEAISKSNMKHKPLDGISHELPWII